MKRLALISGLAATVLLAAPSALHAQDAPVAARDLGRGVTLSAEDIVGEGDAVLGWVTRRVISAGDELIAPAIAAPNIIRSGDRVQLVWRDGALELRLSGKAMGSAAVGEMVVVRVDTKRRYEGVARAPGVVLIEASNTN